MLGGARSRYRCSSRDVDPHRVASDTIVEPLSGFGLVVVVGGGAGGDEEGVDAGTAVQGEQLGAGDQVGDTGAAFG
jgi:hypothetical protein